MVDMSLRRMQAWITTFHLQILVFAIIISMHLVRVYNSDERSYQTLLYTGSPESVEWMNFLAMKVHALSFMLVCVLFQLKRDVHTEYHIGMCGIVAIILMIAHFVLLTPLMLIFLQNAVAHFLTYGLGVSPFALLVAFTIPIGYGLALVVGVFIFSIMMDMWFTLGTFEKHQDCTACDSEGEEGDDSELKAPLEDNDTVPTLERC